MIVNTNWLKKYTDFDFSPEELAEKLTSVGLEANLIADKSAGLENVLVAQILAVNPHPNADRLTVCTVTAGDREMEVVCGAPNVRPGLKVPLALVGTTLPNGVTLKPAKIRGVTSEGMLCAEDELGISDDHTGIMVLKDSAAPGSRLSDYLSESGRSLEIDLTANRPDGASHIGVAREISLLTGKPLNKPEIKLSECGEPSSDYISIEIQDPAGCPRYAARMVKNVQVGPSPDWLVRSLESIGQRSINNIVDAANFVLMETGNPLHTFDYANISGRKIVVRRAAQGEKVVTLDSVSRELTGEILLICDAKRPVAIAGIMGLENSEIKADTRDVLIESAYFNPGVIRKGSRYLGLQTDASYRFERGADYEGVIYALNRLAELIVEVAGGQICQGIVDNYPVPLKPVEINMRFERANRLIGVDFEPQWVKEVLKKLGCEIIRANASEVTIIAPTWRPDLEKEVDLIEELVRIFGMTKVPSAKYLKVIPNTTADERYDRIESLRSFMAACGYNELYCNSLVSQRETKLVFEPAKPVKLCNALSQDMAYLRTSLLPGMVAAVKHNFNRRRFDLQLFEMGNVQTFDAGSETTARESLHLGLILTGNLDRLNWAFPRRGSNSFILKGAIEAIALKYGLGDVRYEKTVNPFFRHLTKAVLGKTVLGYFGELASDYLQKDFDITSPVYALEIDVENLLGHVNPDVRYQEPPVFPSIERDISIIVEKKLPVETIITNIRKGGGELLREIRFYDLYLGKNLDKNEKSLTFNLLFQAGDRTLTDAEIDQIMTGIHANLARELKARLR